MFFSGECFYFSYRPAAPGKEHGIADRRAGVKGSDSWRVKLASCDRVVSSRVLFPTGDVTRWGPIGAKAEGEVDVAWCKTKR